MKTRKIHFQKKMLLKTSYFILFFFFLNFVAFTQTKYLPLNSVTENITVKEIKNLPTDFKLGADISMLYEIEKNGGKFYNEQCQEEDLFLILKENGINWIRLRLWNNPVNDEDVYSNGKLLSKKGEPFGGGSNSLAVDIELAKRAKKAGLKILLDFHYSDSWADPSNQNIPAEWKDLNDNQLNEAIETYTTDCIKKFINEDVCPDIVQIGNELNGGFLWPKGKTWKDTNDKKVGGEKGFVKLLKSAAKGVRNAETLNNLKIKIMIHLADGGKNSLYRYMFDLITKAKVDFDIIGLSFYPCWHGTIKDLKNNLFDLNKRYNKELIVVETAYAFTKDNADNQNNNFTVKSADTVNYPISVQGQANCIRDIIETVASVSNGTGVFYWEPDWIPVKNVGWRTGEGNNWENQALFDFKGNILPSMAVFKLVHGKGNVKNIWGGSANSICNP